MSAAARPVVAALPSVEWSPAWGAAHVADLLARMGALGDGMVVDFCEAEERYGFDVDLARGLRSGDV